MLDIKLNINQIYTIASIREVIIMSKIQEFLVLGIKGVLCIYLPVFLLLYIIYVVIFKIDVNFTSYTAIAFGFASAIPIASGYSQKTKEEDVESLSSLKRIIIDGRWEIIEEDENMLIIKPKFDFPFRLLIDNRVKIEYIDEEAIIEGPLAYVNKVIKDIKGKGNIWTKQIGRILWLVLMMGVVSLPILQDKGLFWEIKSMGHENYLKKVEIIPINPEEVLGNTIENINNYGRAVENDDYIFYVEENFSLIRVNKDFQDKEYIIQKSSGSDIGRLNIVGNWIYYSSGKTLDRISFDGKDKETIYKTSYLMDMHIKDNWIYFINFGDNYNVYRMDINGRELERFLNIKASDIAIYDDRMIFSNIKDGKGYVESLGLDGSDRRLEFEGICLDLIKLEDYYYYIGEDYSLYKRPINNETEGQILLDDKVSSYIIGDENIYYSLHSEDVGYPGKGLYKVGLDGSGDILLLNDERVRDFARVGNWLLFHSSEDNLQEEIKRLNILTDEIEILLSFSPNCNINRVFYVYKI